MIDTTIEDLYARSIDPAAFCDIALHLPFLREQAHGDVVEIGTRGGSSTSALILGVQEHGGHVWSVDITAECGALFDAPEWTFIHGHSALNAPRILNIIPPAIDVLFIDADHSYQAVRSDLGIYGPLVKRGGIIMLHDTELAGAGVIQAVTEYAAQTLATLELRRGCYGLGVVHV